MGQHLVDCSGSTNDIECLSHCRENYDYGTYIPQQVEAGIKDTSFNSSHNFDLQMINRAKKHLTKQKSQNLHKSDT